MFRLPRPTTYALVGLLAACAGEDLPMEGEAVRATTGEPVLHTVEPGSAAVSTGARVTLRGVRFSQVKSVEVGGVLAQDVQRINGETITARFPPVAVADRGRKTVTVRLENGKTTSLANGFEYFFEQDPIVFAHGCAFVPDRNADTAAGWSLVVERFRARGYPEEWLNVFVLSDEAGTCGSNVSYARELDAYVQDVLARTGAPRVDIVAHSMGALASRLHIATLGGDRYVRDWISLAGANHGTNTSLGTFAAPSPDYDGAKELTPAYACEGEAKNDVQFRVNGCTRDPLGADVDETPYGVEDGGHIAYRSIWCFQDEIIVPRESSCLNQRSIGDCSDPVNEMVQIFTFPGCHVGVRREAHVFDRVFQHVTARNRIRP